MIYIINIIYINSFFVVITSVSIKKNLPRPISTTSINIRIYDKFLVLFRTNYISVLNCASPIGKNFFWFSRNDLLMSSLNDFILRPLWHLEIRRLSISISFVFKDARFCQYYSISWEVGIYNYRIFVKELNIKKLSLNLHNNFLNDSTLILCNNGLFCFLFIFVLLLLKHFVSKSTKYRGVAIFLFT